MKWLSRATEFAEFDTPDYKVEIETSLVHLFAHTGQDNRASRCLAELFKIKRWSDLSRPIIITEPIVHNFPKSYWFQLHGRTFKRPGLNSAHPNALWCDYGSLGFEGSHWYFRVNYGYENDSGWVVTLRQKSSQSLTEFSKQIDSWLVEKIESESTTQTQTRRDQQDREKTALEALRQLFRPVSVIKTDWFEDKLEAISKQLSSIQGSSFDEGRMELDAWRAGTLCRWSKIVQPIGEQNVHTS